MDRNPPQDTVIRYSVILSATEVGLGSLVHALKIPLGGHLLSMNQALILTFAVRRSKDRMEAVSDASAISLISALLKSLSPIGNRLGPMLAISAQGLLYAAGLAGLGRNFVGVAVGAALLSVWAILQPLLTAYVFFGKSFFLGLEKLWLEAARALGIDATYGIRIVVALVALKAVLTVAIALSAWIRQERFESAYLGKLEKLAGRAERPRGTARRSPFLSPVFLGSLALSVGFFAFSRNANVTEITLYLARIAGVGALLWFGVPWLIRRLPTGSFPRLQAAAAQLSSRKRSRT